MATLLGAQRWKLRETSWGGNKNVLVYTSLRPPGRLIKHFNFQAHARESGPAGLGRGSGVNISTQCPLVTVESVGACSSMMLTRTALWNSGFQGGGSPVLTPLPSTGWESVKVLPHSLGGWMPQRLPWGVLTNYPAPYFHILHIPGWHQGPGLEERENRLDLGEDDDRGKVQSKILQSFLSNSLSHKFLCSPTF